MPYILFLSLSALKMQRQKAHNDDVLKNWVIKTHERLLKPYCKIKTV